MSTCQEFRIPAGVALQVSKALAQLEFVAGKYGRTLAAPTERRDYIHDFEVILAFGNLSRIGVEFLSKGTIVAAMWVKFDAGTGKVIDSARGIEVPFVPRGVIDEHRLLMAERDKGKVSLYRHYLAINWSSAESRPKAEGETFESDHAAAITASTCGGEFFVGQFAVRRGRIYDVSPSGDWAKAWDDQEMDSVFLHQRYAMNGVQFSVNQSVAYIRVSTPRGPQGRNIRAA